MALFFFPQWSGVSRYNLYQGTYPDAGAPDCQQQYWESISDTGYYMKETYR